ncbi:MAG TPA: hypothetical protein VFQ38_04515 [Longimicrobiales bacterium]|nr:hypothetical protein [Longimicrobiales bacterium]
MRVEAEVGHFVFVSVARPAPLMRAYQAARAEAEQVLRVLGVPAIRRAVVSTGGS